MLSTFYEKECKVRTKSLIMVINTMNQMNRTQNLNSSLIISDNNSILIYKFLYRAKLLIMKFMNYII
jgi:hypothetical protein